MTASSPLLRRLALRSIRFYQRHLSPLKGFSCAYRVHTGRASCSGLGFRAIRRYGVWHGLGVLRERTHLCGVAYRRYRPVVPCRPHAQAGFCDVPACDCGMPSCDLPGCQIQSCAPPNPCEGHDCAHPCDSPGTSTAHQGSRCPSLCDVLDCASNCGDCGCDGPDRRRKNAEDERHIHIPPYRPPMPVDIHPPGA